MSFKSYGVLIVCLLFTLTLACSNCNNCTGQVCTQCSIGFYINKKNTCSACLVGCKLCFNQIQCLLCYDNYNLSNSSKICSPATDCNIQCAECRNQTCTQCSCIVQANSTIDTLSIVIYLLISLGILLVALFLIYHCCKNQSPPAEQDQNQFNPQIASLFASLQSLSNQANFLIKWQAYNGILNREQVCSICLNNEVNVITQCGHIYHQACINKWLTQHQDCPVCRKKQYYPLKHICMECYQYYFQCNLKEGYVRIQSQNICPSCNIKF